jgi:hypothetical protein
VHLLRLVRNPSPADTPVPADTDLLRRYAADRDEVAFAELVRRNGPLVLRACRHVLGEAAADDAFQATLLLLARSAGRLTGAGSLAGWLHAAAVRIRGGAGLTCGGSDDGGLEELDESWPSRASRLARRASRYRMYACTAVGRASTTSGGSAGGVMPPEGVRAQPATDYPRERLPVGLSSWIW